jgi:hypothetical protein
MTQGVQKDVRLDGRSVFIAIPTYDAKAPVDMIGAFLAFSNKAREYGVDFHLGFVKGCSVISSARNILVDEFMKSDCDSLMFIDSDISFDPNDIFRLLAWTQTKSIVGGVYSVKTVPPLYYMTLDDRDGNVIIDDIGLVKAKSIGTGFMMIKRDVIQELIRCHPEWEYHDRKRDQKLVSIFDFKSTPEGYYGEDILFCDRARAHGFEVWIDPMIKLGHFGMHEFKADFANDVLFPMMKAAEIREEEEPLRVAYG